MRCLKQDLQDFKIFRMSGNLKMERRFGSCHIKILRVQFDPLFDILVKYI